MKNVGRMMGCNHTIGLRGRCEKDRHLYLSKEESKEKEIDNLIKPCSVLVEKAGKDQVSNASDPKINIRG